MQNSKHCIATAEIAVHFFITATFALSYDSPHDLAGKGVRNDQWSPSKVIFAVLELNLPPLHLVINWPVYH